MAAVAASSNVSNNQTNSTEVVASSSYSSEAIATSVSTSSKEMGGTAPK